NSPRRHASWPAPRSTAATTSSWASGSRRFPGPASAATAPTSTIVQIRGLRIRRAEEAPVEHNSRHDDQDVGQQTDRAGNRSDAGPDVERDGGGRRCEAWREREARWREARWEEA